MNLYRASSGNPCRVVNGLCSLKTHQECIDVDAFNQNAAASGGFGSNLFAFSRFQLAGYSDWADHCANADQFADYNLDAVYIFQGNPR